MAKLSRTNKVMMAALAIYLVAFTAIHVFLKLAVKEKESAILRRRFANEDLFQVGDAFVEQTRSRVMQSHDVGIASYFKDMFQKELEDGLTSQLSDQQERVDLLKGAGVPYPNSRGRWNSEIVARPDCPDGDDEHVYRLRRAYPCTLNVGR